MRWYLDDGIILHFVWISFPVTKILGENITCSLCIRRTKPKTPSENAIQLQTEEETLN